jgi:T-complex protein 1 subunit eta
MLSNISACTAVVDTVRTTLGRGMDKLIHDDKVTTISNDGATIIRLLDIIHPAAKILVDIAKSQDPEVSIRLPASLSVVVAVIAVITSSVSSP